jgi:hypothetical protein
MYQVRHRFNLSLSSPNLLNGMRDRCTALADRLPAACQEDSLRGDEVGLVVVLAVPTYAVLQ